MESREALKHIADNYFNILDECSVGPQIEGLAPEVYGDVLNDQSTISLTINDSRLPLFGILKYAEWINTEFFEEHGYNTDELYFCLLPQKFIEENIEEVENTILEQNIENGRFTTLIDYPDLNEVKPISELSYTVSDVDNLVTSVGTPAATYHYKADFTPVPEKVKEFKLDQNVQRIQNPDVIEKNFERIWEIYSKQFKALVDDHPINGAIPKDILKETILSEGSDLYAYFDGDGILQSFGYIIKDFKLCPWLNKEYFDEISDGKQVLYMPGIATAPESGLSVSTKIMETILYNNLNEFGEWVVTFECSNISAQYIPMLVERAIENSGIAKFSGLKEVKHMYEVVSFGQLN